MNNTAAVVIEGQVLENLPNTMFRIKVTDPKYPNLTDQTFLCQIAGRMRRNYVRLLPGDFVRFETSGYDDGKGRIVYKIK